jgi:catechol-2,3-dioxygenase
MFTTGLAEIVLIVKDVPASARFYEQVVGLTPESAADDSWAWFWAGAPGAAQRIALHKGSLLFEEHSPLPAGARWGAIHYALAVPPEKLDTAVAHVRNQGVAVYGPTHFEWMNATSFYFYDPDGNLIEFWSAHFAG